MNNFILRNKSKLIIILAAIIIISSITIFALNKNNYNNKNDNNSKNETNEDSKGQAFPYTDDEGRVRYKLMINGSDINTDNHPFKLNEADEGSYYPIKDVLKYFNIESLNNDNNTILTTKINGNIIRVDADQGKMRYGKVTLEALDGNIKTILVNNVLYVPSFFFMNLTNNSIVDYSSDGTAATLTTDLVVDANNSGISGLSIAETNSNGHAVASNGYHICSACGGAGGSNTAYFEQHMVNGKQVQITKYRWQHCPVCGGTGHMH